MARENCRVLLQLAAAAASRGIDVAAAIAQPGGAASVLPSSALPAAQAVAGMNTPSVDRVVASNASHELRSAEATEHVQGGQQREYSSSGSAAEQHGEVPWEHQEAPSSGDVSQPASASPECTPPIPIDAGCGREETAARRGNRTGALRALQRALGGGHVVLRRGGIITRRSLAGLLRGGSRVVRGSVAFGSGLARHSLGLSLSTARAVKLRPLLYMASYRLVQAVANHPTLHGINTGAQVAGALLIGDVMGAGLRQAYNALENGEAQSSRLSFLRTPSGSRSNRWRVEGQRDTPAGWSAEEVRSLGMRGEAASGQRRRVRQVC